MGIKPIVVEARDKVVFDHIRVANLSISQAGVGKPVVASYQLEFHNDKLEDAPRGTGVGGSLQMGVESIRSNPQLAMAVQAISEFAVQEAIKAGLLQVE